MGPVTMGRFHAGDPQALSASACSLVVAPALGVSLSAESEPAKSTWPAMGCLMPFFWADEPSAFSVPVGQSEAAAVDPPVVAAEVGALLSEPQADRASVPTRATPVMLANR